MGKKKDLTGKTFRKLTVLEDVGRDKHGGVKWLCQCSCGNKVVAPARSLSSGDRGSCGCLRSDSNTTHGLIKHPLYKVWIGMKTRCLNLNDRSYDYYGGRGIVVCDRWVNSVVNFIEDVAKGYEEGLQLDRIDNDGNYEPTNVRWVTHKENSMNRRGMEGKTSHFKGVCWKKDMSKWLATITKDSKTKHLGYFNCEREAAITYNEAAFELFGEYAYLNKVEGSMYMADKVMKTIDEVM